MSKKQKRKGQHRGGEAQVARATPPGSAVTNVTGLPWPPTTEGPGDRTFFDSVRENLEAFLVAVILAVIIRHFAVEAFEIPTGSMANTLYGIHTSLECPNCSTDYNVALKSDSSGQIRVNERDMFVYDDECPHPSCTLRLHSRGPGDNPLRSPGAPVVCASCRTSISGESSSYRRTRALERTTRCPMCDFTYRAVIELEAGDLWSLWSTSTIHSGNKILVTKFAYSLGKPERWDVIVFSFDQWKNYIKRLVGLPGEQINIWDGDLYINGKVEMKSKHAYIQDTLWRHISSSDVAERGLNPMPAWVEVAPPGGGRQQGVDKNASWSPGAKRWSINSLPDTTRIEYQRPCDNYYSYNLLGTGIEGYPAEVVVGDRKVAFTVKAARTKGEGWVGAEIRDGDFTFQLRLPVGTASAERPAILERIRGEGQGEIQVDGLRATHLSSIPLNTSTHIELENVDDRVVARLNGEEILTLEYRSFPAGASFTNPPVPPSQEPGAQYLRIVVSGAQAELESLRVYRDMYYIPRNRSDWTGVQLGDDEYFALGDNAPSSADGRYWGALPAKNLMGKALLVFWPAMQCKFIR